jgi:hypothetical protein
MKQIGVLVYDYEHGFWTGEFTMDHFDADESLVYHFPDLQAYENFKKEQGII